MDVAQVYINLLWFENLLLMRLWVWSAYLVVLWNRALAYPWALLPTGGPLSCEFWQLTIPLSFFAHKTIWSWPLAAILNFGYIFKKSRAHPHVTWNMLLKFEKNDQTIVLSFCVPQKIKADLWRPFWISVKPWKSHLHISISWGVW